MVIVDASVTNKLFLPNEEGYEQARDIFQQHTSKIEKIIVPTLLVYEVANTLATKTKIPAGVALASLQDLYELELDVANPTLQQMHMAIKFSKKYKVSVYDAIYAVLAKENKCDLITADGKFVEQVGLKFVKNLGS